MNLFCLYLELLIPANFLILSENESVCLGVADAALDANGETFFFTASLNVFGANFLEVSLLNIVF